MKIAFILSFLFINSLSFAAITSGDSNYTLDASQSSASNCPVKLTISTSAQTITTTLTHQDGLININIFNFNAPVGLIKGLAYPFGVFSYYRNYQDENGFYFQRQNCERIGVFKECGEWTNMQSYEFIDATTIKFELRDLFYRLNSSDYPTDLGRLPLSGFCVYKI